MTLARALFLSFLSLAVAGCTGEGKTDAKTGKSKPKRSGASSDAETETKTGGAANPLAAGPQEPATAEGLKALMTSLMVAQRTKDRATQVKISQGLMPTFEQAKLALDEGCDPRVLKKLEASLAKRPPDDDPRWEKLFRYYPKRTEVKLHPATVAQIANKAPEAREFPGGAVQAANMKVLRDRVTFYEVEFTEPGKDMGVKYHLVFHDGSRWRMLGKIWRALPRK